MTLEQSIILIVDDTPNNLAVLSDTLADAGFEVAIATSGNSALRQLTYAPVDLILLDVMMPGIDGFETCRRIKEIPRLRPIPIIFMTALAEAENKVKGLEMGAVDYITKPFQQAEVLARVRTHLEMRRLNQTLAAQNQQLLQFNQTLEQLVAERTAELSRTLADVKQMQLQLVQGEKMSALGSLVAGIAHEINNPVNFIHGNITHAEQYVQDLLELIDLYEQRYPEPHADVAAKQQAIDLEFVRLDLPKLVQSLQLGSDRIRGIIKALRNFSRLDESVLVEFNPHDGLDSTLMILQTRIKATPERPAIEVVKDYGPVPPLRGYPGQLNQVFMNLLVNAIDAIDEASHTCEAGRIVIRTELVGNGGSHVQITIADNGIGMDSDTRRQVFDYLFTTKPLGKGTGLGLAISRDIVEQKHGGVIHLESDVNQGCRFTIQLPVAANPELN